MYLPHMRGLDPCERMPPGWTVIENMQDPSPDPHVTALEALGWILADQHRAQRFLDVTGLSPNVLRATAAVPSTHRAVLDYLCAYEPDLLAASEALEIQPEAFPAARRMLGR